MSRTTCHWMTTAVLSLALFSGQASAGEPCNGCTTPSSGNYIPRGFYLSVFGGGGNLSHTHVYQRGTAFFAEDSDVGGPLAVDTSGNISSNTVWFWGANIGYAWVTQPCCIIPAVELEGLYLRNNNLNATVDSSLTALPEHTFSDSFPMNTGVFLINGLLSFNTGYPQTRLYLGAGIGGAILSISGANSLQISPPEPGVNHFNAQKGASTSAFAGQIKAGISYSLSACTSLFAEYRFLYVAPTRFDFGSTVYPGHAPTSPWGVNFNSMYYNLGTIGIRFNA